MADTAANRSSDKGTDEVVAGWARRWDQSLSRIESASVNIQALVQWVVRQAYLESIEDLRFHAEKVRFFNELKKKVRDEVGRGRRFLAAQLETAAPAGPDDAPVEAFVPVSFRTSPTFDEDGTPQVATGEGEPLATPEALRVHVEDLEQSLNTVGDDAQLANIDLQSALQRQQQQLQLLSNVSKMLHDTAMATIRNTG